MIGITLQELYRPGIPLPFHWARINLLRSRGGNRWFESSSLQRRESCELADLIIACERPASGYRVGMLETSAGLGACLLVLTVAVVLDRRPYRPGKRNYIPIMIVALAASLVLGRHLLSLIADIR